MIGFDVAATNVLLTIAYMIPGYIACKAKRVSADHLSTLSFILVYICGPCMIVSSFLSMDYTPQGLQNLVWFFVITFALQCAFMAVLYMLFRKRYGESKYRILTIASVLGNAGFFGMPVVKALLPENPEVACYSATYIISMNIIVFTMGVYCLTQKREYMTPKAALLNPSTLGLAVGIPLYILGAARCMPATLLNSLELLGNMTTPLCMMILGIRLATVSLKKLFTRPLIYAICACKLVLFPLFCFLLVWWLPFEYSFRASVVILGSVPCASVILNLAEIHHSETELAANCVLVSTLLCFLTIPAMTLLL